MGANLKHPRPCTVCGRIFLSKHRKAHLCSRQCMNREKNASAPGVSETAFWASLRKTDAGCWEWTGSRAPKGYGHVSVHGRPMQTHRRAYELAKGPIPRGAWVLHRCDNPPCCNPDHLFLGDNSENVADKVSKQRQVRGERTRGAKLTAEKVLEMRRLREKGVSYYRLARMYGVTDAVARLAVIGKTWKHVPSTPGGCQ